MISLSIHLTFNISLQEKKGKVYLNEKSNINNTIPGFLLMLKKMFHTEQFKSYLLERHNSLEQLCRRGPP